MRSPVRAFSVWVSIAVGGVCLWAGGMAAHAADAPADVLAEVDEAGEIARAGLSVHVRGQLGREAFAALIQTRGDDQRINLEAPLSRKGEVLLFAKGRLWYHRPGNQRPTAVSLSQSFGGGATAAELLLAVKGLRKDYKVVSQTAETLEGQEATRLELSATSSAAPWPQLRVWIVGKPRRVIRAAVLDKRGEPVRTMNLSWENAITFRGEKRPFPSKVTVEERGKRGSAVALFYDAPAPGEQPADLFLPARLGSQ